MDAAVPDAAADAAIGPSYVFGNCSGFDTQVQLPGRTLPSIAMTPVFALLLGGDSPLPGFGYRGHAPVLFRDGTSAVNTCVPRGGESVAGGRGVRWILTDPGPVESFEETCSQTFYAVASNPAPAQVFAEHAFPGMSAAELSAVRVLRHHDPPLLYTTNKSTTEYVRSRPERVLVRDGFVATPCGALDEMVTFLLPTGAAIEEVSDVACAAGTAEHAYPKRLAMELGASVRVVLRDVVGDRLAATADGEVVYRDEILENALLLDDERAGAHCLSSTSSAASGGASSVTFVRW